MTPHRHYDPTKPYRPQMAPPVLRTMGLKLLQHMRMQDAKAFAYTAWWHHVYLIVRRSNRHSIRFIGETGFTPKPVDCKAKTARQAFFHTGLGRSLDVAGLVCDPTLPEFEKAFGAAHGEAMDAWKDFRPHLKEAYDRNGNRTRTYLADGRFFVDLRPESPTYGVIHQTDSGLVTAGRAVHGDYDLFGIVPADNPSVNIALTEEHPSSPAFRHNIPLEDLPDELHVKNCRGRKFTDVQMMLNRMMGVPMILHGSQEKYTTKIDPDQEVDVFFPDGEHCVLLKNAAEIRQFYAIELRGRKMMDARPSSPNHGKPMAGSYRALA